MTDFNKEELLKIAQLSAIKLNDDELATFSTQIQAILAYVDQIQEVLATDTTTEEYGGNINVLRQDEAIKKDPRPILECAPQVECNYFVVPKIFEDK